MRTKTIKIYNFEELSKERQEQEIDNNREINVNFDWWDCDLDCFIEDVKLKLNLDLNKEDIYFEIMSRSNCCYIESEKLVKALNIKYNYIIKDFDLPTNFGVFCNYLGGGLCSGLNNSEFDKERIELEKNYDEDEDELKSIMEDKQNEVIKDKIIADLSQLQEMIKKFYKGLYEEYEYLVSDEGVKETLILNEVEFDE